MKYLSTRIVTLVKLSRMLSDPYKMTKNDWIFVSKVDVNFFQTLRRITCLREYFSGKFFRLPKEWNRRDICSNRIQALERKCRSTEGLSSTGKCRRELCNTEIEYHM